ncbi:MAG: sulfotransferase domain-containing protein [Sulfuricurvum sp.]|jgi:hypothetical protein|uniref:sulfotransferase domain-containing protein n=1 Tax=Sulfuricurvum sp. TaxID=2025608 RepID=UPI0025D83AD0|nr:sulfotransferase domain-containing protein [Sulfuricurvum sp.]MCK9372313.1 sulfotransferase domain-containing protein [Sulfuricurvum sp.]
MQGNPKLFWLASYPKSGNTWTRAFIANLLNEDSQPVDINEFNTGAIASSRAWIQKAFDFDINELSHDEIDRLRPMAYRWLSDQAQEYEYHKTHDAFSYVDEQQEIPLFPKEATAGALIIVRNPLDVSISFAHHSQCSIDKAIDDMAKTKFCFCGKSNKLHNQLRQWLWSWSQYNRSWMEAPVPKLLVRYEDMKAKPLETFTQIATFLKLPNDEKSVSDAIEKCRIEKLQEQEAQNPFKERPAQAKSFFRKGIVGDWKNTLSQTQIETIVKEHSELMLELDYLDKEGNLK